MARIFSSSASHQTIRGFDMFAQYLSSDSTASDSAPDGSGTVSDKRLTDSRPVTPAQPSFFVSPMIRDDSSNGKSGGSTPLKHGPATPIKGTFTPSKSLSTPSKGGISMLRSRLAELELATHPAAIPMSRQGSRQSHTTYTNANSSAQSRRHSTGGASECPSGYEVAISTDFASSHAETATLVAETSSWEAKAALFDVVDGEVVPKKMTADDFEPLSCIGKGAFGTVLLVKQRATGRLYAQKQFKKASLVIRQRLVEQTMTERQILEAVGRHPFVVTLYYAFQDKEKLYLILEYGVGGELFTHLNSRSMFSEAIAAFYMAEMVLALDFLHDRLGVVYRDLKPENCLLDAEGHLLLTDFGLSKVPLDGVCTSMSGTAEYMAPEVVLCKKYGQAVDWWSLGILGFDLMTGGTPFYAPNNLRIQEKILKCKINWPTYLSEDAKDILGRFIHKNPKRRLGSNMPRDLNVIRKHPFFRQIDWLLLLKRKVKPPIEPIITDPEWAENFDPEFTEADLTAAMRMSGGDFDSCNVSQEKADAMFGGFTYVAPSSFLEQYGNRTRP